MTGRRFLVAVQVAAQDRHRSHRAPEIVRGRLRRSNRDAADGAVEELQRIVGQIRQRWPRVRVVVRGDAGFCRDELMAWCEAAEGVDYVFGLAQNARQQRRSRSRGLASGRGARGQPALGGDQPGAGADRDPAAVRAAVLCARGQWRTASRSSSWTCSRTGLRRRRCGRTSCGCTGPCSRRRCWRCCDNAGGRGRSWRGCGRRRRDSLWASGRDSRGATRGCLDLVSDTG